MENKPRVRLGYIRVGQRDVHWQEVGAGQPLLVMLHADPGSGKALLPLACRLTGWRVLVLDTPGCGRSDSLPGAEPSIDDYARATLEALAALGVKRCAIFGTHTGAKIALAVVHADPERFQGIVLDGLGVFTPDKRADQLAHYTPHHEPVADGSHLIQVWHQVRDMALFWPWYAHDGAHRLRMTPPSPESLHETVVDMLRNLDHYALPYRAAFRHDPLPWLISVPVPTLLLAAKEDPLHAHLGQIAVASDRVMVDAAAYEDIAPRVLNWLEPLATSLNEQPAVPAASGPGNAAGVWRTYLKSNGGKDVVHVTVCSPKEVRRRPLVAVHACPGSSRGLLALGARAGRDRLVVLPDLPGLGASSLPAGIELNIETLSGVLGETLAGFVGEPADLYGTHTGAAFALEWAVSDSLPARSLLLDGMILEGAFPGREELLKRYAQPLPPHAYGLHMLDAWHRVRDMMLFWPWYQHQAETARIGAGIPSPRIIHELVVDLLAASTTYHHLYNAAFRYRAEERLERLTVPALLSAQRGDPLAAWLPVKQAFAASLSVDAEVLKSGLDGIVSALNKLSDDTTAGWINRQPFDTH